MQVLERRKAIRGLSFATCHMPVKCNEAGVCVNAYCDSRYHGFTLAYYSVVYVYSVFSMNYKSRLIKWDAWLNCSVETLT